MLSHKMKAKGQEKKINPLRNCKIEPAEFLKNTYKGEKVVDKDYTPPANLEKPKRKLNPPRKAKNDPNYSC